MHGKKMPKSRILYLLFKVHFSPFKSLFNGRPVGRIKCWPIQIEKGYDRDNIAISQVHSSFNRTISDYFSPAIESYWLDANPLGQLRIHPTTQKLRQCAFLGPSLAEKYEF